jgi:hypothetical protein
MAGRMDYVDSTSRFTDNHTDFTLIFTAFDCICLVLITGTDYYTDKIITEQPYGKFYTVLYRQRPYFIININRHCL